MKKIISISTDRNIFTEGSAVRARQIEYGGLFDELHIIIFTKRVLRLPTQVQIAPRVWVYGTHSFSKFLYTSDAVRIAQKIICAKSLTAQNAVVTTQDPFETGIVGLKIKKKFELPLHVQIHTDFLSPFFVKQSFLNRLRIRIARKMLRHADAVRVVSKKIAESMKQPENKIFLKNGVLPHVLPIFSPRSQALDAPSMTLKETYPQFDHIILVASRFTKEKNIPLALRVFAQILQIHPKTGLVVVGSGPEENRLKNLAKRLLAGILGSVGENEGQKTPENVIFEPWKQDLSPYYKSADLFLLTSNFEGYGLTLVEAISAGCPVVSTDVGIARAILGENAIPFGKTEKETEINFFRQTLKLLEDSEFRKNSLQHAQEQLPRVAILDKKSYLERYKQSYE